jgi:hypothetical protein
VKFCSSKISSNAAVQESVKWTALVRSITDDGSRESANT